MHVIHYTINAVNIILGVILTVKVMLRITIAEIFNMAHIGGMTVSTNFILSLMILSVTGVYIMILLIIVAVLIILVGMIMALTMILDGAVMILELLLSVSGRFAQLPDVMMTIGACEGRSSSTSRTSQAGR